MRSARGGRNAAKTVARFGVLGALVLILGLVERQFTLVSSVPGIKLGLSNVVLLLALALMSARDAWALMLIKVLLGGALYAGVTGMFYSFAGGLLSMCVMTLAVRLKRFGFLGVSVMGAGMHMVGQVLMSRALIGSWAAAAQLPVLLACGVITGALTGAACAVCAKSAAHANADMRKRLLELDLLGEHTE